MRETPPLEVVNVDVVLPHCSPGARREHRARGLTSRSGSGSLHRGWGWMSDKPELLRAGLRQQSATRQAPQGGMLHAFVVRRAGGAERHGRGWKLSRYAPL